MIELIRQKALAEGNRLQLISIERLHSLQAEIELLIKEENLNKFQSWIVKDLYKFKPPADFAAKSIIIVAIPHPPYAEVELIWKGDQYRFKSLVMSDFESTKKYLTSLLVAKGYRLSHAPNLPLKRLAVHSGLAVYGRNNICYVDGLDSYFSFDAYFSDFPCTDNWLEIHHAEECTECSLCVDSCPTGAINSEPFLINNERCLTYFNESPRKIPDWVPLSAHHCLYGCLKCQMPCPMNKGNGVLSPGVMKFTEEETDMLLTKEQKEFTPALEEKCRILGLDQWIEAIPRNLKILLEQNVVSACHRAVNNPE